MNMDVSIIKCSQIFFIKINYILDKNMTLIPNLIKKYNKNKYMVDF